MKMQDNKERIEKIIACIENELEEIQSQKEKAVNKNNYEAAAKNRNIEQFLASVLKFVKEGKPYKQVIERNYQYQLEADKLFGKVDFWEHRTMRTVFDPYGPDYRLTDLSEKKQILTKFLLSGFPFEQFVKEYKNFYINEGKPHVAKNFELGMEKLIREK